MFAPGMRSAWFRVIYWITPEVRNAALVFAVALVAALLGAPAVLVMLLASLGLLLAAWAVRRRGAELAGPIFFYDVVRLARRGRSTLLRCMYALVLLGVLYLVYWNRFPYAAQLANLFHVQPAMKLGELAHFGGTFATAIFAIQSAAVLLLTPAYVSGAISEEKEKRTLELLFTTHLTDREIILGKMFGRLTHLFGIVLVALPILMALQLWGGVEPLLPIAGFVVTVITLLSAGSICIHCSVSCRDSFTSLVLSYLIIVPVAAFGMLLPGCFFSSPVAFMIYLEMLLGAGKFHEIYWPLQSIGPASSAAGTLIVFAMTVGYAFPHLMIAYFCTWGAVRRLRAAIPRPPREPWVRDWAPIQEKPRKPRPRPTSALELIGGWDPVEQKRVDEPVIMSRAGMDRVRYPVTDSPLLWKEAYHQAGEISFYGFWRVYLIAVTMLVVLLVVILSIGLLSEWGENPQKKRFAVLDQLVPRVLNPAFRVCIIALACVWCVGIAWRNATSISRERDGQTLGALLTLPVDRSVILGAKWCGGIVRFRWLGYALLALGTVGVGCGALHPAAALLMATAIAVHIAFLASLAVSVSLACRNTFWSNFTMTLMLLLVFAGSWVAAAYYELFFGMGYTGQSEWWDYFAQMGLNPLATWWSLGFNWEEWRHIVSSPPNPERDQFSAVLAGMGVYAALAGLLWWLACQQLRRLDSP